MKTLHFIRHAKSSWSDSTLKDEHRPIKKRGISDCQLMSPIIQSQQLAFDRIYSSPATRAQMTIEALLSFKDSSAHWITDEELYTFSAQSLMEWWQNRNDTFNHITQVGHNPAMTDLIEHLTGQST